MARTARSSTLSGTSCAAHSRRTRAAIPSSSRTASRRLARPEEAECSGLLAALSCAGRRSVRLSSGNAARSVGLVVATTSRVCLTGLTGNSWHAGLSARAGQSERDGVWAWWCRRVRGRRPSSPGAGRVVGCRGRTPQRCLRTPRWGCPGRGSHPAHSAAHRTLDLCCAAWSPGP